MPAWPLELQRLASALLHPTWNNIFESKTNGCEVCGFKGNERSVVSKQSLESFAQAARCSHFCGLITCVLRDARLKHNIDISLGGRREIYLSGANRSNEGGKFYLLADYEPSKMNDEESRKIVSYNPRDSKNPWKGLPFDEDVARTAGSDECLNLLKQWMATCVSSHAECDSEPEQPLPTRVLDVSYDRPKLIISEDLSQRNKNLYHEWRISLLRSRPSPRTFHERLGGLFLAGLWGKQLPRDLSWYPLHPGEVVGAEADADSAIPSWTWASIKGGVPWSMATRGFRFDTTCRVIEAESNPVSDINPFGSVKGGHLVLEGWFRPATVLSQAKGSKFWKDHLHGGFYNLKEWPASSFYADAFLGTAKVEVDGDAIATAVRSLETEQDKVPDEMDFPVWCFVLGTHKSGQTSNASVVVLGVSASKPGTFERVGFVELELGYRSAEDFFADWDVKMVTMI
ncbi:hypothetical protein C8034_v000391 [Colletotrichum sidae]|uniref:Heterokaryon incompatibility domain-containing protein n=1 Tax=Colletotrichum sidae TaxID=1347389 RepID=A0A4R8TGR7_9PEZI|nr:hypothetical protein C8034_v000391 [Colletotrichum sidae]